MQLVITTCRQGRLAVAIVDLEDLEQPRVAAVNGRQMMYSASVPKIAVLLAAFQAEKEGRLTKEAALSSRPS